MIYSTSRYKTYWEFLKNAAILGKLSHAYVLSGNDEASQQELAMLLSQFLNCESQLPKPCQRCLSCRNIESRSHPDLLWIEGVREIPIGAIRNLHHHMRLGAWQSSFQIVVIERAHLMNQEAQSSLLKNLEEPKKNTIFLLLTLYPHLLFDTIRSRVQELRWYVFPSVSRDSATRQGQEVLERLRNSLLQERFEYAKKAGETAEDVVGLLLQWMKAERIRLLARLQDSGKEEKILKTMQDMLHAVQTTQVTPRLALEQVLLEL